MGGRNTKWFFEMLDSGLPKSPNSAKMPQKMTPKIVPQNAPSPVILFCRNLIILGHFFRTTVYDWDCARSKDGESLLIAQQATRGRFDTDMVSSAFEAWTPVIDDELLDSHPLDAIRAGRSGDKNIMIGHTTGEGAVFVYATRLL